MIFKIETNKNFKKKETDRRYKNIIIDKIYKNFLYNNKVKNIYSIKKNSNTSKIYQIDENNGKKKILRSSDISEFNKINWAIKKITILKKDYFFSLIKTKNQKYIYRYKNKIYLLYNRVPGNIYSGKILEFYDILKKAIRLHYDLNDKKNLKV